MQLKLPVTRMDGSSDILLTPETNMTVVRLKEYMISSTKTAWNTAL